MKIAMIAAVAANRVIGKDNDLVWRLPDDMKFFMQKTTGHHIIMGRKNYESLPQKFRPLPNRINIVMTRKKDLIIPGVHIVNNMEDAIKISQQNDEEEAFIIGGGEIYKLGLTVADTMYITEIKESFDGDAFFPEFDTQQWVETERTPHDKDDRHAHTFDFVTYKKKK